MRAVVFRGEGKWAVESVAVPRVRADDDVLLKVDRGSICGTDLHILSVPPAHPATPGSILGHEYVATVVEGGNKVTQLKSGDRVVVNPNVTCGICRYCQMGLSNVCENMTTLGIFRDGGLAEFNLAPARALHKISRDVPPDRLLYRSVDGRVPTARGSRWASRRRRSTGCCTMPSASARSRSFIRA